MGGRYFSAAVLYWSKPRVENITCNIESISISYI